MALINKIKPYKQILKSLKHLTKINIKIYQNQMYKWINMINQSLIKINQNQMFKWINMINKSLIKINLVSIIKIKRKIVQKNHYRL